MSLVKIEKERDIFCICSSLKFKCNKCMRIYSIKFYDKNCLAHKNYSFELHKHCPFCKK